MSKYKYKAICEVCGTTFKDILSINVAMDERFNLPKYIKELVDYDKDCELCGESYFYIEEFEKGE